MQKFNTLQDAIALAEYAHRSQIDKSGQPYILHPKRVLDKVQAQGALPYMQMAAILHDVPEDTAFSHDVLGTLGFSEAVTRVTRLLDRNHQRKVYIDGGGELSLGITSSPEIDEFYYTQIRVDAAATMIKLADIEDNLSPWRLAYLSESTQVRLGHKYAKALRFLRFEEKLNLPDKLYVGFLTD